MKMKYIYTILILISFTLTSGCKKFVQLDPPDDRLTASTIYATNETATSVLNGLYVRIAETNNVLTSYATAYMGFASDELKTIISMRLPRIHSSTRIMCLLIPRFTGAPLIHSFIIVMWLLKV